MHNLNTQKHKNTHIKMRFWDELFIQQVIYSHE